MAYSHFSGSKNAFKHVCFGISCIISLNKSDLPGAAPELPCWNIVQNKSETNMGKNPTFFTLLLPLIWGVCSFISYYFPGDEYALYFFSSIVGTWIAFLIDIGDIHQPLVPLSIAVTGATILSCVGFLMDRLRVERILWASWLVLFSVVIFFDSIHMYPDLNKALSKNGSVWAYILFSINMGLYISVVLSVAFTGLRKLVVKDKPGQGRKASAD
jgi:hypothetical protein